jgi:hypothetical protein
MTGKWPELLKQFDAWRNASAVRGGIWQLGAIQAVAPSLQLEASAVDVRNPAEIDRAIPEFSRKPNGGLIV